MYKINIEYTIINYSINKKSNIKNITIKVKYPNTVTIVSPKSVNDEFIHDLVESKSRWILNKLNEFKNKESENPPILLVDGDKIPYLGNYYTLNVYKEKSIIKCSLIFKEDKFIAKIPYNISSNDQYIKLREMPAVKEKAAEWFHSKWGVSKEAYLECMNAYLKKETEYGWYLCLDGERIVGGLGVIENDFHDRKDLTPNVCAVYTEENYRGKGIAGKLLNIVVEDMKGKGISPLYLITDHTSFYERYGWEFLCMVQGDGEEEMTRMYIHR